MNYHTYKLSPKEYIYSTGLYITVISVISYLFYYSFIPLLLLLPGIYFFFRYVKKFLKKKRERFLVLEFKDFLNSLSALLSTGYSLENAIIEANREFNTTHKNSLMASELHLMVHKLNIHIPIEDIFADFASRSDIEILKTFSQILTTAKQTGGDLVHIITATNSSISSQIEVRLEIDTALSGKRLELYIMAAMPIVIMFYIKFTQSGFFTVMYHNITGIIIMSLCLILYIAAVSLAYKILSITD